METTLDQSAFESIGLALKDGIITGAEYLTLSDSRPGLIAAILLLALVFFGVRYWINSDRQLRAIRELDTRVRAHADIETFASGYADLQYGLKKDFRGTGPRGALWEAWDEFNETVVTDDVEGPVQLRNSIRPASFMNVEDLGFGPGTYRILPNTFVSVGLLLTFLGLVAALDQFSDSMGGSNSGGMDDAMRDFMQIASAKFVMSLVGLICSIAFTVLLRSRQNALDRALHNLCMGIERRLVFVSLEDLGFRQLRAAKEQAEHLREIGMGMVAELQKPLDALPDKMARVIDERMGPLFDRVGAMGAAGMEGMVGDLSAKLSDTVSHALTRASESLGEATERMGTMVERMGATNAAAGEGLETALGQMAQALGDMRSHVANSGKAASDALNEGAERLLATMNETLAGIRENTGQGAEAMRGAADQMRQAAEGFREALAQASAEGADAARGRMTQAGAEAGQAIETAGQNVLAAYGKASADIAKLGTDMGTVVGGELLSRLEDVGGQLERMGEAIRSGTSSAQSAANGMNSGAEAIHGASETFRAASRDLASAAAPLKASHERIEASLREVGDLVRDVSETLARSATSVAENAAHVLETAQTALGTEREGIRRSLAATETAMRQLSVEAEKLDEIDIMLGRALTDYAAQLEAALGTAQDHVGEMRDKLAPGLDTLKSVVEQAESFMPSQRRTRA